MADRVETGQGGFQSKNSRGRKEGRCICLQVVGRREVLAEKDGAWKGKSDDRPWVRVGVRRSTRKIDKLEFHDERLEISEEDGIWNV